MNKKYQDKVTSNEIGLEIGLVLSRFFFNTEHLHFGYWPDNLSLNIDNLKQAQDYHSDQIINAIPKNVDTILDVGSGSGGLAEKLIEKQYKVECVSPSEYLSDAIEEKLINKVKVHRSTFENLNIDKKFDLVIFSESFQYVNIQKTLSKVPNFLNKNSHFLICDFFRKPGTGNKLLGGGHAWDEFYNEISSTSFENILDQDITIETARTYDLINKIINNVAEPVRELSAKYLESNYPKIMKLLRWYLDQKIKRINRIYFSGNMTGETFINLKTYRLLLYKL